MKKSLLYLLLFGGIFVTQKLFSQNSLTNNIETGIQYLSGTGSDDAVEWEFFCTEGRNLSIWYAVLWESKSSRHS